MCLLKAAAEMDAIFINAYMTLLTNDDVLLSNIFIIISNHRHGHRHRHGRYSHLTNGQEPGDVGRQESESDSDTQHLHSLKIMESRGVAIAQNGSHVQHFVRRH